MKNKATLSNTNDLRSALGYRAGSMFENNLVNPIHNTGRIDMTQTFKPLIAFDRGSNTPSILNPGSMYQKSASVPKKKFQGGGQGSITNEVSMEMLVALEPMLLQKHLSTLKKAQKDEFMQKYTPLDESMRRAALMQMMNKYPEILEAVMQSQEGAQSMGESGQQSFQMGGPIEVTDFQDPRYKNYNKEIDRRKRLKKHNDKFISDALEAIPTDSEIDQMAKDLGVSREVIVDKFVNPVKEEREQDLKDYKSAIYGKNPPTKGIRGQKDTYIIHPGEGDVYDGWGNPLPAGKPANRMGIYHLGPDPNPVKLMYDTRNINTPTNKLSSQSKTPPAFQTAFNLEVNGQLVPITKKAYNNLLKNGEIIEEFNRPTRLRPGTKVFAFKSGGEFDNFETGTPVLKNVAKNLTEAQAMELTKYGEAPSQHGSRLISNNSKKGSGYESSGRKIWRKGMKDDGSGELISLQTFLKNKGFYTGEADGIYGKKTEEAVKKYQDWFNKNAKYEMFYTPDGKVSEQIGGPKGKKIDVDGVVGDQTRTALLYREMPESPKNKKKEWVEPEFPVGEGINQFRATDYTPTDFPDSPMNYAGGAEMMGWALLGMQAAGLGSSAAQAELIGINASRNLTGQGIRQLPRNINPMNPNIPNIPKGIGPRRFSPQSPSNYGTRIGYQSGGELADYMEASRIRAAAFDRALDEGRRPLHVGLYDSTINNRVNYQMPVVNPVMSNYGLIDITDPMALPLEQMEPGSPYPVKAYADIEHSSKSKSRNRFRERKMGGELSAAKAEKMLHDGTIRGKKITDRQRRYFAAVAYGNKQDGGETDAQLQEALATVMGYRNDRPKGMALGGYTQGPGDPPKNDVPLDVLQVLDMINLKSKAAKGLNALKKGLPLAGLTQMGYYISEGNNMRAAANIVPFLPDLIDEVAPGWDSKEHNQRLANATSVVPKAWETYKSKIGLSNGGETDAQYQWRPIMPYEGFQIDEVTSNRPVRENTIDISAHPQGIKGVTTKTGAQKSNKKGSSRPSAYLAPKGQAGDRPTWTPTQGQPNVRPMTNMGFMGYSVPVQQAPAASIPVSNTTAIIAGITRDPIYSLTTTDMAAGRARMSGAMPTPWYAMEPAPQPQMMRDNFGQPISPFYQQTQDRAFMPPPGVSDRFQFISNDRSGRWENVYDPVTKNKYRRDTQTGEYWVGFSFSANPDRSIQQAQWLQNLNR